MTYKVSGDKSSASFEFGGPLDDDGNNERREAAVRQYFGDKPIYYPPFRGGAALRYDPAEGVTYETPQTIAVRDDGDGV